jgi:hypothetical protein
MLTSIHYNLRNQGWDLRLETWGLRVEDNSKLKSQT